MDENDSSMVFRPLGELSCGLNEIDDIEGGQDSTLPGCFAQQFDVVQGFKGRGPRGSHRILSQLTRCVGHRGVNVRIEQDARHCLWVHHFKPGKLAP